MPDPHPGPQLTPHPTLQKTQNPVGPDGLRTKWNREKRETKDLRTGQELKDERKHKLFTWWGRNGGSEKGNNLPKVTQQPRARGWLLTQGDMVGSPHSGLRTFWIFILTQQLLTLWLWANHFPLLNPKCLYVKERSKGVPWQFNG